MNARAAGAGLKLLQAGYSTLLGRVLAVRTMISGLFINT